MNNKEYIKNIIEAEIKDFALENSIDLEKTDYYINNINNQIDKLF